MMLKPALRPPMRAPMRSANSPREGVGAWGETQLASYLASLSDGLYFDTTKTDRFFQENIGPTLGDDVGEAIGLALDQRSWNGLTLAQLQAAASELRGGGTVGLAGSATAATYNTGTGEGTASRVDVTNQSYVRVPGLTVGKTYKVNLSNTGASALNVRADAYNSVVYNSASGGATIDFFFLATDVFFDITTSANGSTVSFTLNSVKLVPGNHGVQATGILKPVRQAAGAKFDGSDDNWLTTFVAGSAGNFIVALVTVPASLTTNHFVAGSQETNGRFYLGFDPSGHVVGGVGEVSASTIVSPSTYLDQEIVVGLAVDTGGAAIRLFAGSELVFSGSALNGPTTTRALRVGAGNPAGTAASFWPGAIKKIIAGRDAPDLARYRQIRQALLAA